MCPHNTNVSEKICNEKNLDDVCNRVSEYYHSTIKNHLNDKNVRTLLDNLILNLKMEGKIMSIDPVYIKSDLDLYTKIANFIASKDQGNYVRTEKEYKNLFNQWKSLYQSIMGTC